VAGARRRRMPGMPQRVTRSRKRATRWRFKGGLALAIIVPVVALVALAVQHASPVTAQVRPAAETSATAPAGVPAAPAGWSTVFSDDFTGAAGSGVDSQWQYDTGPGSNFGTGEIETMTNSASNVHLDGNGNLDITAVGSGGSWTSGRIQTTSANVGAPAGGELEVTASIEQPSGGAGYWPAFWMLGPGRWPENGEIDIMEDVNSLSELSGTIHCGTDPGGPCNEPDGIGSGLVSCSGCQSGYHTYSMILNRASTSDESITFYLDGNEYFSVSESQVGTSTWQAAFDHNMSIILDLAMGGSYPDGQCGCTTPASSTASGGTMSVAYVAAYTTSSPAPAPTPTPAPSSTPSKSSQGATGPVTGFDGLCVDVRGANSANFTPVQVYTCNNTDAQQWTVVEAGSTLHALGKCLDIDGGGSADGTTVDLYDCNDTAAQVFIPQSDGALYNPQSNKCLDDTNWSTTPGTQLQIWDCTGNANQRWNLP
jgi:Ricin-type beta-trefoil lectin domain